MKKTTITVYADGGIEGYISQKQAAEKLKVPVSTLRTWIHRGVIPSLRIGNTSFVPEDVTIESKNYYSATKIAVNNIEYFCLMNGVGIGDFERAIGISTGYISRCKNGKKALSIDAVERAADYMNVPISSLLINNNPDDIFFGKGD